ncbi:serine hydrolase domain-containing protein [Nocardia sp. NPDC051832]|uniref:serine hydrolase domain-containing protein n=1 Tax=Nocardia sp. NPDC051832 TaxID=3155673 RepID=UPI003422D95E
MAVLLLRLMVVVGVLMLGSPTAAAQPAPYAELDRFVRDRMRALDIPGVAYAVVEPAGIVHTGTAGVDGAGAAVTDLTPFLWGSAAKPVTATLITALAEQGRIQLDAPVVRYLPAFRTRDEARSARITIRHLLAQTSGFATSTRYTDRTDSGRKPADVLPELADAELVSEPGAVHHYSSTNYLILSAVVEAITGRAFPDVLTEMVLAPLGMHSAVTDPEGAQRVSRGHRFVFGQAVPFAAPFDPVGVGYGYLGGTVRDAAAFAAAGLGGVLTEAQRAQKFEGEARTSAGNFYGLGWRRGTLPDTESPMVWHGGAAPGYFAHVVLLPDRSRAVVLLANAYGTFHEPQLLATGFGLAQLADGVAAKPDEAGYVYWSILAGLLTLALLLVAANVFGFRSLRREPGAPMRAVIIAAAWSVGLGALLYAMSVLVPGHFGVSLGQIVLWAPDIAWLLYGSVGLAVSLALLRVAIGIRGVVTRRG